MVRIIPEELIEGRSYLELAEKEQNPLKRLGLLQEGYDLIGSCEENYPEQYDRIRNLQRSHIRRTLNHLSKYQNLEMEIWLKYVLFLNGPLGSKFRDVIKKDSELATIYSRFEGIWIDTFKKVISS